MLDGAEVLLDETDAPGGGARVWPRRWREWKSFMFNRTLKLQGASSSTVTTPAQAATRLRDPLPRHPSVERTSVGASPALQPVSGGVRTHPAHDRGRLDSEMTSLCRRLVNEQDGVGEQPMGRKANEAVVYTSTDLICTSTNLRHARR